jgi:hypothetical protein
VRVIEEDIRYRSGGRLSCRLVWAIASCAHSWTAKIAEDRFPSFAKYLRAWLSVARAALRSPTCRAIHGLSF